MNRREQVAAAIAAGYLASTANGVLPNEDDFIETVLSYTDALFDALSGVVKRGGSPGAVTLLDMQNPFFSRLVGAVRDLDYSDLMELDRIVANELTAKAPKDQIPSASDLRALANVNHLLNHCSREVLQKLQTAIATRLQENPSDDELLRLLGQQGGVATPSPWEAEETP